MVETRDDDNGVHQCRGSAWVLQILTPQPSLLVHPSVSPVSPGGKLDDGWSAALISAELHLREGEYYYPATESATARITTAYAEPGALVPE